MRFDLREHGVRSIVLDIEGTTTPIAFVYEVLFPFARAHLREFLQRHADTDACRETLDRLRVEWEHDAAQADLRDGVAAYVEWLMDRDSKSPGLKRLQGLIWERGYRAGLLRGEVFPDVPPALERWRQGHIDVAIYSSGSELAQRLLFESTPDGDLTRFIPRFFDTTVGPKNSPDSYRRITRELGHPAAHVLFVSDVTGELAAAHEAGYQVLLCVRPGNRPQPGEWPAIDTFDDIEL